MTDTTTTPAARKDRPAATRGPSRELAQDVLQAQGGGAHRRDREARQRGPDHPRPTSSPARSAARSTPSTRIGRASWASRPPDVAVDPRAGGPRRHRHAAAVDARASSRSAARPACLRRVVISAGFKEVGAEGAALERAGRRAGAALRHARHRPQLPGRHEPHLRAQRHVRGGHGAARAGSPSWPERRAHHGRSSTGACASRSASAPSSRSARWPTWAGATSSTTSATTPTPTRSCSTWRPWATRAPSCRPCARSRWRSPSSS